MELDILTQTELRQEPGQTLCRSLRCSPEELQGRMQELLPNGTLLILWRRQDIVWGRWLSGQPVLMDGSGLDARLIQELRAFNEDSELHLTRCGREFRGRWVQDLPEGSPEAGAKVQEWDRTDLLACLWGEHVDTHDCPEGYVCLQDRKRGIRLTVPCEDAAAERYGLLTRNYVGTVCAETGQAGYVDYRFVGIVPLPESALAKLRERSQSDVQ